MFDKLFKDFFHGEMCVYLNILYSIDDEKAKNA